MGLGAQSRGHFGQGARPSQDTITHQFIHSGQFRDAHCMQGMSLNWGKKSEYLKESTERTCKLHTQNEGRNETHNPAGGRQMTKLLTSNKTKMFIQ